MDLITSIIENFAVTLLGGVSVVAIVFYFYFILHPEDAGCAKMQGLIYKLLRIGMFIVFAIAIFNLILYLYDNNIENSLEFVIKSFTVLVVFVSSILLSKHIIDKKFIVPIIVGCWQFLALFHFYVNVILVGAIDTSIFVKSILSMIAVIAISFGVFFSITYVISRSQKNNTKSLK